MSRRDEDGTTRPATQPLPENFSTPNAFSRELFDELHRRDHHPATPEADFAGAT